MTALLVGLLGAIAVGLFASRVGFDRDRAFYPTVMIVIAFLYVLFALQAGSTEAVLSELLVATPFVVAATVGFKKSQWLVVAALAGHGAMDLVHHYLIANPGVPAFWPGFCSTYDFAAAAYLAALLVLPKRQLIAKELS